MARLPLLCHVHTQGRTLWHWPKWVYCSRVRVEWEVLNFTIAHVQFLCIPDSQLRLVGTFNTKYHE